MTLANKLAPSELFTEVEKRASFEVNHQWYHGKGRNASCILDRFSGFKKSTNYITKKSFHYKEEFFFYNTVNTAAIPELV